MKARGQIYGRRIHDTVRTRELFALTLKCFGRDSRILRVLRVHDTRNICTQAALPAGYSDPRDPFILVLGGET